MLKNLENVSWYVLTKATWVLTVAPLMHYWQDALAYFSDFFFWNLNTSIIISGLNQDFCTRLILWSFWSLDLLEAIQGIAFYVVLAFSFSSLHFHFLSLHFHKNIKNHFVSYEYFKMVIWHGLNFEHFKNLEDLEKLKNLDNWVLWTLWELTCRFRSILSSDLGLNSFESCFFLVFRYSKKLNKFYYKFMP